MSARSWYKIMVVEGLWKPKRAKPLKMHPIRERRACQGELVQIDGSDHDWFEGRGPRCTLLVFIDDATGQLMELCKKENKPDVQRDKTTKSTRTQFAG